MTGSADRIDVRRGVDEAELFVGGVAGESLDDVVTVDDPVVMDQSSGELHPSRSERMLRPVVVPGGIVAVPDELHPLAQGPVPDPVISRRLPRAAIEKRRDGADPPWRQPGEPL